MFHLLPKEQKNSLLVKYRIRLAFIVSLIFLLWSLVAMVLLLPSYFLASLDEAEILNKQSVVGKMIAEKNGDNIEKTLSGLNNNLELLMKADIDISKLIEQITKSRSYGIYLNRLSFSMPEEGIHSITISGNADSRTSLLSFSKNLKMVPEFKTVDLPISNLAKNSDIDFVINVTGDF